MKNKTEVKKNKHELGEIWKDGKEYKIQLPKGIATAYRLKDALEVQRLTITLN